MMHGTIHIRSSLNIFPVIKSRRMIQTGHPGRMGGGGSGGEYRILGGKRVGKRPIGSPKCKWDNYIKMGLNEGGWEAWT